MTRLPTRLAAATAVLALAACSTGSSGTIARAEVEKKASLAMKKATKKSYPVTCPGDLEARKGATMRCWWTDPKKNTLGITVTLKSDDRVNSELSVKADSKVTPAPKA